MAIGNRTYVLLKLKIEGQTPRVILLDTQDLSIGRSDENDLAIDDPEISRRHARFARVEGGWVVEDQGTSNGTAVNGVSAGRAQLASGDVIRVGGVEIVYAETTRNPAELGAQIDLQYASQLKGFGGKRAAADGDATILGLMDALPGDSDAETFQVRPAGDFDLDLNAMDADDAMPPPAAQASAVLDLDEALESASRAFSVQLEVEGLTPDLEMLIRRLLDRDLALPKLRLRLKAR
ncbi:MAG: FHA domain-containing protein [Myxococcales bacterium]|nr:FHA domain-containing protein [Myxococcales bacterium]MDH5567500.1 FHA domain-containing protein [Myxococcales bacterium]